MKTSLVLSILLMFAGVYAESLDRNYLCEGDTKGMYSSLGWKLDSDNWNKDVPSDLIETEFEVSSFE